MALNRTRFLLEKANNALEQIDSDKEVISGYFTEHILIVFYAEIEEALKSSLFEYLSESSTVSIAEFLSNQIGHIAKRISKKDLVGTLKLFGETNKTTFNSLIDDTTAQEYSNYITNRHFVAHPNNSITISWDEIQNIAIIGEKIITAFRSSLRVE